MLTATGVRFIFECLGGLNSILTSCLLLLPLPELIRPITQSATVYFVSRPFIAVRILKIEKAVFLRRSGLARTSPTNRPPSTRFCFSHSKHDVCNCNPFLSRNRFSITLFIGPLPFNCLRFNAGIELKHR